MKCKCPECGNVYEAEEYDPQAERDHQDSIEREANDIMRAYPEMQRFETIMQAKEIVG